MNEMEEKVTAAHLQGVNPYLTENQIPKREGLYQRLKGIRSRSQQIEQDGARAKELLYLFEKHPDVARILELLDAINER